MKLRILESIENKNGNTTIWFIPQYKSLFGWRYFYKLDWWSSEYTIFEERRKVYYHSKDDALKFLSEKLWLPVETYRGYRIMQNDIDIDTFWCHNIRTDMGLTSERHITKSSIEGMKRIIDNRFPVIKKEKKIHPVSL